MRPKPMASTPAKVKVLTFSAALKDSEKYHKKRHVLLGTGSGVRIGQVELGRPGKPGKDMPIRVHGQVQPTEVYAGNSIDGANSAFVMGDIGEHATEVAGIMIAKTTPNNSLRGVAPDAELHAGAMAADGNDISFSTAANRIARISGMRAINVSEGVREFEP